MMWAVRRAELWNGSAGRFDSLNSSVGSARRLRAACALAMAPISSAQIDDRPICCGSVNDWRETLVRTIVGPRIHYRTNPRCSQLKSFPPIRGHISRARDTRISFPTFRIRGKREVEHEPRGSSTAFDNFARRRIFDQEASRTTAHDRWILLAIRSISSAAWTPLEFAS